MLFEFCLQYITENVPGPMKEMDLESDEKFRQIEGCVCSSETMSCSVEDCPCMKRFGPAYDVSGKLIGVDPYQNVMRPLFECNSQCRCSERCANRVVQNGVSIKLRVFRTQRKGLGVKAMETISQNRFVCEYVGEILSPEEAKQRTSALQAADANFIMAVNEHYISGREATYIDPRFRGNVGRFINHSCDPNLFLAPVHVDDSYPRVAMFALRTIEAGEELSYNYSGDLSQAESTLETPLDSASSPLLMARKTCHCQSVNCRKYLPIDTTLCLSL